MKKKFISLLAASLGCMMILGGCGSKDAAPSEEQVLNTIYYKVATLDANDVTDSQSSTIINAIQEGLVRIHNDGTKDIVEPAGAESWESSEDGLTWTFKLRKMNWSDGEPVVAQHYVDSFMRILDPENAFAYGFLAYDIVGAEERHTGDGPADAVGVKAVDDYTLEFTLKYPVSYFVSKISYTSFQPIRLDIVEALGDEYASNITDRVYNGPFKIESWDNGNSMVLVKNDTYWDAENVKLDTINMTNIAEFATQAQLFEAGELDITGAQTDYIQPWSERAESGEFQKITGDSPSVFYFYFNQDSTSADGILANAKIRKALGLAVDRDVYTKDLVGRYVPAYGIVPTAVNSGDEKYRDAVEEPLAADAKTYVNNPEKLQELFKEGLKELGLQTDDLSKYELTYLANAASELEKQRAEWVAQQITGNLGIKINVEIQADWGIYLDTMDKQEFDFTFTGWGADYDNPMSFLDIWVSGGGNNHTGYASSEYDALLDSVTKEADAKKVTEIYKEVENKLINEDAVISPIYYADKYTFSQNYVKGMEYTSFGSIYEFKNAYIEGKN